MTKTRIGKKIASLMTVLCMVVALFAGIVLAAPLVVKAAGEPVSLKIHGLTGDVLTEADLGSSKESFDPTRPYIELQVSSPGYTDATIFFSDGTGTLEVLRLRPMEEDPTRLVGALDISSVIFQQPGGTTFSVSEIHLEAIEGGVYQYQYYGGEDMPPLPAGISCSFVNQVTPDNTPRWWTVPLLTQPYQDWFLALTR